MYIYSGTCQRIHNTRSPAQRSSPTYPQHTIYLYIYTYTHTDWITNSTSHALDKSRTECAHLGLDHGVSWIYIQQQRITNSMNHNSMHHEHELDEYVVARTSAFICVTWLYHMCGMTHSYVRHDSSNCTHERIHNTHSPARRSSPTYSYFPMTLRSIGREILSFLALSPCLPNIFCSGARFLGSTSLSNIYLPHTPCTPVCI